MPFIPHTEDDIRDMLDVIGVESIGALFFEIPENLKTQLPQSMPEGLPEMAMTRFMQTVSRRDRYNLCFLGAGAYEHHIPSAVWEIASRGEFMTAYTPYQAEASQGSLQVIYEYQTMIAHLMGMDVSNASNYDGASSLAEAALMALRLKRNAKRILVPTSLHPAYRDVLKTILQYHDVILEEIPFCAEKGVTLEAALEAHQHDDIAAVILPQPNFFGVLENVDTLTDWAHAKNALVIGVVNPIAMALIKEPGQWGEEGADIVCGEGQPLGIPLSSGGPYFGFLCCKKAFVRQLPGRIVGRTVDKQGKPGFTLTLQAREQHIRRAKATSNICTNQGLMVTAATIYMSLLGFEGLQRIAVRSHHNANDLLEKLKALDGVDVVFQSPFFHEVLIRLPRDANKVLQRMADASIQAGFHVGAHYPELNNCILVCATETKTQEDIQDYIGILSKVLQECGV